MSEVFLRFKHRPTFRSRFYHWSIQDAQREVLQNFPLVSQVKSKTALTFLAVMRSMSLERQIQQTKLLVRYLWKDDLKGEDNPFSDEEFAARKQFFHQMHTAERKLYEEGALTIEKNKIDYKAFRKLLEGELSQTLGSIFKKDGIYRFAYRQTINTWNIDTYIFLGGRGKLDYMHIISSDVESDVRLEPLVVTDLMRWLGIGQTDWGLLNNQSTPITVRSVNTICSHFINQVPALLADLSPDIVSIAPQL